VTIDSGYVRSVRRAERGTDKIIVRLMKMLTRLGYLVEGQGMTCMADMDTDNPLASLQVASCTYRIAASAARRTEGAEFANRGRPGRENRGVTMRRSARLQRACRGALWRPLAEGTRTPVPLSLAP
jgi:hypothetical protein